MPRDVPYTWNVKDKLDKHTRHQRTRLVRTGDKLPGRRRAGRRGKWGGGMQMLRAVPTK